MAFDDDVKQQSVANFITLYTLDARKLGADIYYFHGHNDGVIRWRGQDYTPIAIKAEGLEMRGDGKASMPKLVVADHLNGIEGAIGALCRLYDDFAGATLTITYTMAEYLDSPDVANYREQTWYIEQKTGENPSSAVIEFELSNPVDFAGAKIPVRNITNFCYLAVTGQYRSESCGYIGANMFTDKGEPTNDPYLDRCGGCLSDCKLRFGEHEPLSFMGFPASGLI